MQSGVDILAGARSLTGVLDRTIAKRIAVVAGSIPDSAATAAGLMPDSVYVAVGSDPPPAAEAKARLALWLGDMPRFEMEPRPESARSRDDRRSEALKDAGRKCKVVGRREAVPPSRTPSQRKRAAWNELKRAERGLSDAERSTLDALRADGEWKPAKEIPMEGYSAVAIRMACRRLFELSLVARRGSGRRAHPYEYRAIRP